MRLKDGQSMVVPNPQGFNVIRVAASQTAPVPEANALPRIEQFLANQRGAEAVSKAIKDLRGKVTVTYMGDFAGGPSAAGAATCASGGGGTCSTCNGHRSGTCRRDTSGRCQPERDRKRRGQAQVRPRPAPPPLFCNRIRSHDHAPLPNHPPAAGRRAGARQPGRLCPGQSPTTRWARATRSGCRCSRTPTSPSKPASRKTAPSPTR